METIASVVLTISILVFSAEVIGILFERINLSRTLGEITAGFLLGPYFLGKYLNLIFESEIIVLNEPIQMLSEIAVIILMFVAGLEVGYTALKRSGLWAAIISLSGTIIPFIVGYYYLLPVGKIVALISGAALAASSTVIVSRFLEEVRISRSFKNLVINASVVEDLLGIIILSVVLGLASGRVSGWITTARMVMQLVEAWFLLLVLSVFTIPSIMRWVEEKFGSEAAQTASIAFAFGLAGLSVFYGLSPVIGAYIAGVAIAESKTVDRAKIFARDLEKAFAPLFFTVVGMQMDPSIFTGDVNILIGAILLGIIAVITKIIGVLVPMVLKTKDMRKSIFAGSVMTPRGVIGLVIAVTALNAGLLTKELYNLLVGAVVISTALGLILSSSLKRLVGSEEVEVTVVS